MGQDHSKRTCGGPNPLVVQLRAKVDELEAVIEGGKEQIKGLETNISDLGAKEEETAREHERALAEQEQAASELRDAAAAHYAEELERRDAEVARLTEENEGRAATMAEQAERIEVLEREAAEAREELGGLRPANEALEAERARLDGELSAMTAARDDLAARHESLSAEHKKLQDQVEEEAIAQLENNMQRSQQQQSVNAGHTQVLEQLRETIRVQEQQAGLDQATVANLEFKMSKMEAELFGLRSLVGEDAAESVSQSAAKNLEFFDKEDNKLSPYLEKLAASGGASGEPGAGGEAAARPEPLDPNALGAQIWGDAHGDAPTPPPQPDSPMSD